MARLTDPEILARYTKALADWKLEGAIELIGRAHEGLRTVVEGITAREFKEAIYCFVCEQGGEIDQVKEQREPWRELYEWHFDLRPTINGVKLYIETRLYPEAFTSDHEPIVKVVQIKPA